eukprot:m.96171 g.96171  ORF g.96171 m.96171 type:complete len:60 (+) comp14783_c0_seq5:3336-3515(+)
MFRQMAQVPPRGTSNWPINACPKMQELALPSMSLKASWRWSQRAGYNVVTLAKEDLKQK